MTVDRVETLRNSTIQHGPLSNRVYLMSLDPADCPAIIADLDALARDKGYTKIFAKAPENVLHLFLDAGYREEARVPGFFRGEQAGVFLGRYLDPQRRECANEDVLRDVRETALAKAGPDGSGAPLPPLPEDVELFRVGPDQVENAAAIYGRVFASYPFPVHDPGFLRQGMEEHGVYFLGARQGREWLGLSSAEPDMTALNAELTDMAVLPEHRGLNLARHFIRALEKAMADQGIRTFYTIARAVSFPMNITFAREGYALGGTLVNNTNISGAIESMTIWYKSASGRP